MTGPDAPTNNRDQEIWDSLESLYCAQPVPPLSGAPLCAQYGGPEVCGRDPDMTEAFCALCQRCPTRQACYEMGLAEVRRGRKFGKPKVVLETIWGGVTMKELKEAA